MRRLWVLAWIATSGCVEPSSLQCSDGRTCPTDTTCDLTHNLCATDAQIAGCVNKSDGDACSFSNQVGTCDVGVCIGSSCGNGSVDPGEACDDHNQTGGDGCSADCSKTELCGDAVVDVGEACDDGDSNPANGCDACVATGWTATAVIGGTADPLGVAIRGVHGITVGTDGAVYFVENHRVRRLDPTGVITTVAGIGIAGFSGDGGLATSAKLNFPNNVAVDGLGNVYFADFFNHRIRRVDPSGIITTVAGSGAAGFSGDNGPAIAASLNKPRGISVDGSGNLYIADSFNLRIRYVDVTTGIITTIAGGGVTSGDGPATTIALGHVNNIVFDSTPGTFYFTDEDSDRICKVANGMLTTVAGTLDTGGFGGDGGPATSALLNDPEGLARDAAGNLYRRQPQPSHPPRRSQRHHHDSRRHGRLRFRWRWRASDSCDAREPVGTGRDARRNGVHRRQ